MEGMEHLSLTKDGLDDDPMFSYTQAQLYHHEVAQALLANQPPPRVLRGRSGLIGFETRCSTLTPSTTLGLGLVSCDFRSVTSSGGAPYPIG
jgi:hypothetical protein